MEGRSVGMLGNASATCCGVTEKVDAGLPIGAAMACSIKARAAKVWLACERADANWFYVRVSSRPEETHT